MNFIKVYTLLVASVLWNDVYSQTAAKQYSGAELNQDFNYLVNSILTVHPDPFTVISEKKFHKQASDIQSQLNHPLSLKEYYRLIAPFVASLHDGHTRLSFPGKKLLVPTDYLFPFIVKSSIQEPYLKVTENVDDAYTPIPVGAEIISINSVSARQIIQKFIDNTSGETDPYRLKMGADFSMFGILLNAYYPFDSGYYEVQYKSEGQILSKKIKAVTVTQLMEIIQRKKNKPDESTSAPVDISQDYSLVLHPEIKTAVLEFKYMDGPEKFQQFLKDSFVKIRDENIQNLIIDIRENGGGNSSLGDNLLSYISAIPFSQYTKTLIKYSQLQKDVYEKKCEAENINCSTYIYIKTKNNGTQETILPDHLISPNSPQDQFNGKVYLLTSIRTFSSAMNFAQTFKYYKIGTIIGEETGGRIVSFGDYIPTELPHTKIPLSISTKKFYTAGATDKDIHGVIPDIKTPSDQALSYVVEKIKNGK